MPWVETIPTEIGYYWCISPHEKELGICMVAEYTPDGVWLGHGDYDYARNAEIIAEGWLFSSEKILPPDLPDRRS
jgi:hypothetical protein